MDQDGTFLAEPATTREAIMRATYLALCDHGYADLTIQRIADEFEKSKSLLYHHYDGKDDLLLDFLAFMLEDFAERMPLDADADADEQLSVVLDHVFRPPCDEADREFTSAMAELRAQAAHDEDYRAHFSRNDQFFRDRLADLIRTGVEQGVFRDVDAERVAAHVQTLLAGAMTQRVTADADHLPVVRAELDDYLRSRLLADEGGASGDE